MSQLPLNEDEIIERLRINDPEIITAIHRTCFELIESEGTRTSSIDSKGSTLMGMSGVSASIIFSLGGLLIDKISNIPLPIIGCPIPWLVIFYMTSTSTLFASIILALLAIRARSDWRGLGDEDIFHKDMINENINTYKRYMAAHAWIIYKNNFDVNELKGCHLKRAHILLVIGLMQLLPIILIISLYVYKKGGY